MLKKFVVTLCLGLVGCLAGLLLGQSHAYACTNGVCGYYKNGNDSGWCNVLPDPSIKFSWRTGNCWLNSSGGNGHSLLYGNTSASQLISNVNSYLYQTGGTGGYNSNSQAGAAFLIDDMMGIDYHNGNTGTGINDARAQFNNWANIVNALGVNHCSIANQLTCPGASFGINFGYVPPYFCTNPVNTSAYDPWANDTPIYWTGGNSCDHDWNASKPEIVLYWNNGANSFHIGSQCGNVQSRADKLPSLNHVPTGNISVTCTNAASGQQTATVTFSDTDGATTGYVTVGSWRSGDVNSPAPPGIPLPAPPTTTPYASQTVTLFVKDYGPLSNQAYVPVATSSTQVPCATLGCGGSSVTPVRLDPYMSFTVTVSVANGVGQTPPGATMTLNITPPSGATYTYSGSQAAGGSGFVSTATFSGLGPTNKTGLYNLKWTLTGGGLTQTCTATFPVVYMPYLNVYGGDVFSGASSAYGAGASSCATNPNGGVFSWNNYAAGYSGAGAQYAVQALGQIQEFATAVGSTNVLPVGLSFANYYNPSNAAELNTSLGLFGGNYGSIGLDYPRSCDFTSDLNSGNATIVNTDLTIPATSVAAGAQKVYYVTGGHDVYISGNITYAGTSGWGSISQIPYFKVVDAGGDIYIDSSVTQLDGIFVAESNNGTGRGSIYTCASGLRAPASLAVAGTYLTCNKKLVINGVFVAKQVYFLRTNGSVGLAKTTDTLGSNHSAEVFNYTPEVWLPRGANTPGGGYTAITGLPPVL